MSKEEKIELKKKYMEEIKEAVNDLKTPGKRHKQIPNLLTASRLLSPLVVLPAAITGNVVLTASLAAAFGLTDCLDGVIARRYNLQSELGKDLDAITDKVYVGTLLIASAFFNPLLLCNLALEGAIAGINIKQKLSGRETGSTMIGKYKTWAVFGLAALGLISPQLGISTIVNILALATSAMQGLTIGSYLTKYGKSDKMIKTPEPPKVVDRLINEEIKLPPIEGVKEKLRQLEQSGVIVSDENKDFSPTLFETKASDKEFAEKIKIIQEQGIEIQSQNPPFFLSNSEQQKEIVDKIISMQEQGIEIFPSESPKTDDSPKVYLKANKPIEE